MSTNKLKDESTSVLPMTAFSVNLVAWPQHWFASHAPCVHPESNTYLKMPVLSKTLIYWHFSLMKKLKSVPYDLFVALHRYCVKALRSATNTHPNSPCIPSAPSLGDRWHSEETLARLQRIVHLSISPPTLSRLTVLGNLKKKQCYSLIYIKVLQTSIVTSLIYNPQKKSICN